MNVMIGIDPHKASHTAVAIDGDEDQLSSVKVRATRRQVDQLMIVPSAAEKREVTGSTRSRPPERSKSEAASGVGTLSGRHFVPHTCPTGVKNISPAGERSGSRLVSADPDPAVDSPRMKTLAQRVDRQVGHGTAAGRARTRSEAKRSSTAALDTPDECLGNDGMGRALGPAYMRCSPPCRKTSDPFRTTPELWR
jgi:ribosomal protein L19E